MKRILYAHSLMVPLIVATARALAGWVAGRLRPAISRLLPGDRGRRVLLWLSWALGLALQATMLWMLSELVSLCISLYELWAYMAGKFVEQSEHLGN